MQLSIRIAVPYFVMILLTNFVLSELVPINFQPQSARAQERDEAEENEDNDEGKSDLDKAAEPTKEKGDSSKETDFSQLVYLTSIDICCSWDSNLADGKLTYKMEYDGDDGAQNDNSDLQLKKAVIAAIKEWNEKLPNIELVDISTIAPNSSALSKDDADIEVKFVQDVSGVGFGAGGSGQIAGVTTMTHDNDGFMNKSIITLPKTAFYVEKQNDLEAFASSQYSSQLKEVAIHEIGHALGLGHANFEGDIMNQNVSYDGTTSISDCDVEAVSEANHWKILYNTTTPVSPTISNINC
jgi:predicted Zn-dependent protease